MHNRSHTPPAFVRTSLTIVSSLLLLSALEATSALHAAEPDAPSSLITKEDALEYQLITKVKKINAGKTEYDRKIVAGLENFYLKHGRKPVWLTTDGLTPNAKKAIEVIKNGYEYGLNTHTIKIPTSHDIASNQADAELALSKAILTYAKQAKAGNLNPQNVSRFLDNTPEYPEPFDVLSNIAAAKDPQKTLLSYHPTHPQFWALKKQLDKIRNKKGKEKPQVRIPAGGVIRPYDRHPHITLLRERLNVQVPTPNGTPLYPETIYDSALISAVKEFQAANGLRATGIINRSTRAKFNKRKPNMEKKILANMERWRWMPQDFGRTHIRVNIPEFLVRVTKNDKVIHTERVITGKRSQKTPSFSDEMETVVLNPYWNVPQSIIWNEMGGVAPRGYESRVVGGRIYIRQPPGPRNALGRVKFLFPNKHSVYLHDTPTKNLFNRKVRAFSHGCMRLRNPMKMAEIVLAENGLSPKTIHARAARGRNDHIPLKNKIPVHVTYFTLWASPEGSLSQFNDIYGHDKRVSLALEGRPLGLEPRQRVNRKPIPMVKKKKKNPGFVTFFFN